MLFLHLIRVILCTGVLCDQVAVLLRCLVGLDRSVYLSSAASIAAATHYRTCQKFIAALQQVGEIYI